MSQILSLRIPDQMVDRLDKFARRLGNGMTRTKAGVMLLEESLRETEYSFIEFRDSPVGRQPYMKGSGLAIWEVIMIAKGFDMDAEQIIQYYPYPIANIKAAINYFNAYSEEINQAIEDNHIGFDSMKKILPNIELFEVSNEESFLGSKR